MVLFFSVEKDAALLLKLESDTILTLKNQEYTITTIGGGSNGLLGSKAMGANLYYSLPIEFIQPLTIIKLKKIRIYTTDGYLDQEINGSSADTFKEALQLLNQTKAPVKQGNKF